MFATLRQEHVLIQDVGRAQLDIVSSVLHLKLPGV
jgi:hypothetical protein